MAQNKHIIEIHTWEHYCGDRCCHNYGEYVVVNGKKVWEGGSSVDEECLKAVVDALGLDADITTTHSHDIE